MSDGYLYAISLVDGGVKIGRTQYPETRLMAYGYDEYSMDSLFITNDAIKDADLCEKRICYLLRESLYRGREYFKCSFDDAVSAIKTVCLEIETGKFKDSNHLETENLRFTNLAGGTKRQLFKAAKDNGHDTVRQFFVAWCRELGVSP